MISGFRVARGGAQELLGVEADLTVMGKVLGGGLPAAAYGGSRELMERVAPAGDVYQAGTLSGNPLAVAAGLATLRELDAHAYDRIDSITERLAGGLRDAAGDRAVQVSCVPGLLTVFFSADPVRDFAGAQACDRERTGASAVPCSIAGSIRPPPSSRRGSPRWHTMTRRSTRRSSPRARPSRGPRLNGARISHFAMTSTATSLTALAALLRDGESVISPYVRDSDEEAAIGALAASGPRAADAREEYTLLVEAIREGYLLHYETPRLIDGADGDLRLLAGDYLYALGLERLATRGDLDAVRELADLISLVAQVHAENGDGSASKNGLLLAPLGAPSHQSRPSGWRRQSRWRGNKSEAQAGQGGTASQSARRRRSAASERGRNSPSERDGRCSGPRSRLDRLRR